MMDDIRNFIDKRVSLDILAKTHAFKVEALARRLAYEYSKTPYAKERNIQYPEALKVIGVILPKLHAKAKTRK